MNIILSVAVVLWLLPFAIPLILLTAALGVDPDHPFVWARRATTAALLLASSALLGITGLDAPQSVMLTLVSLIGFVITRYADPYLEGDPGRPRFARALLATLGAVAVLVVTDHLGILAMAWMGSSLALHQLLTHQPKRTQALVVAHKKFLVSRLADAVIAGAVALLFMETGTLDISMLREWAAHTDIVPWSVQAAMLLMVVGVALKSAQLPFHGWLTQVMEAPTPVSALLHAGVVNIGGFVLIRLAPVVERSPVAMVVLVGLGLLTTIVAASVMATQRSIKVKLAWSTCAQMGLMLVQCGLGAWSLALLHLVAHSAYKAHAFLSSGSTVDHWRTDVQAPPRGPVPMPVAVGALFAGGTTAWVLGSDALSVVLVVAMATHLASGIGRDWRASTWVLMQGAGLVVLTSSWHLVFGALGLPGHPGSSPLSSALVIAGFVFLYLTQAWQRAWPTGRVARWLRPHLYAGLYLDEAFSRLTFRLWPPKLPPRRAPVRPAVPVATLEA